MKSRILPTLVLASLSFACNADESPEGPETRSPALDFRLTPEQLKLYDELLSNEKRGFVIPPGDSMPNEQAPELSGEWLEVDGVWHCDGYFTRIEDEEFCSAEVPSDWEPFEFEGQTYFLQPLADSDH